MNQSDEESNPSEFDLNLENNLRHEDINQSHLIDHDYSMVNPRAEADTEYEVINQEVEVRYPNKTILHKSKMLINAFFENINNRLIATSVTIVIKAGEKIVNYAQDIQSYATEIHKINTTNFNINEILTKSNEKIISYIITNEGRKFLTGVHRKDLLNPDEQIQSTIQRSMLAQFTQRNQEFIPTQTEIDAQSNATSIAQTHYSAIPEDQLIPTPGFH
jgi:hypothetical protein